MDIHFEHCHRCPFFSCYELGTCYNCSCDHPDAPEGLNVDDHCADHDDYKRGFPKECPFKTSVTFHKKG